MNQLLNPKSLFLFLRSAGSFGASILLRFLFLISWPYHRPDSSWVSWCGDSFRSEAPPSSESSSLSLFSCVSGAVCSSFSSISSYKSSFVSFTIFNNKKSGVKDALFLANSLCCNKLGADPPLPLLIPVGVISRLWSLADSKFLHYSWILLSLGGLGVAYSSICPSSLLVRANELSVI